MQATQLSSSVDRAYAERQDAKTRSVRDEIREMPAHPYDDYTLDTIIDPSFFNGLVVGKGGKHLNFNQHRAMKARQLK